MDINTIINDGGDVEDVRRALYYVKAVLQVSAYDYAHAALGAANEVVKSVHAAVPAVAVWPHLQEFQAFSNKSHAAIQAVTQATSMLLMAEETGDPQVDSLNQEIKIDTIDIPTIFAILEGAATRINLVSPGIPKGDSPGARCDPSVLEASARGGT